MERGEFRIVIPTETPKADEIEEEFNRSIRFATVPVALANTPPQGFVQRIPPLSEAEAIGTMIGLPVTRDDLLNLLLSKFPDIDLAGIENEPGLEGILTVVTGTAPSADTAKQIRAFLRVFDVPGTVAFRTADTTGGPTVRAGDDPMFIRASRLRRQAPRYVQEDERFWFDNIEEIGAGRMGAERFPGMAAGRFRCYFDLTLGETDHVNLRQALLLYDELWCSAPLWTKQDRFLDSQRLAQSDLLELVEAGRLRLLTTQPEERLDRGFLEAVHERSPDAVLGRRTTAALLVANMAGIYAQSFLSDPRVVSVVGEVTNILSTRGELNPRSVLQLLLWPLASLRGGLQSTLDNGSKGGPFLPLAEGLATLVGESADPLKHIRGAALGEPVHLAHALDATVFGPVSEDRALHRTKLFLGQILNFHKCFNAVLGPEWTENERRRASGVTIVPSVPLFEFDAAVPMAELLEDTRLRSTRDYGRTLYARLAAMDADERAAEVERLNAVQRQRGRRKGGVLLSLDTLASIGTALADAAGVGFFGLARFLLEALRQKNSQVDRLADSMAGKIDPTGKRAELDFLTRVDRVASLKRERI